MTLSVISVGIAPSFLCIIITHRPTLLKLYVSTAKQQFLMNSMKRLRSRMYFSGFLLAQLPLTSAGMFSDVARANSSDVVLASEADPVSSVLEADLEGDSVDRLSQVRTLPSPADSDAAKSDDSTLKVPSLLEPLASLSQSISNLPLLQSYRSQGETEASSRSVFPLAAANYLPSGPLLANSTLPADAVAESAESASDVTEGWQAISSQPLKQWRQPSIEVVSVDIRDVGRSLNIDPPVKGLKKVLQKALPQKSSTTDSSDSPEAWHSFCFSTPSPYMVMEEDIQSAHQLIINDQVVAEFATVAQANLVAKRLRSWIQEKMFSPSDLVARIRDGKVLGLTKDQVLFEVDQAASQLLGQNRDTIAIAWVNNLRQALHANPLNLVDAQVQLYGLQGTGETMDGTASWYGPYFHGRQTASGEYFHEAELTVAHKSLPFDTFLKVTNLENDQSVVVRVNDRGPYIGERSLDLSRNAAQCLGSEHKGVIPYHAVILKRASN